MSPKGIGYRGGRARSALFVLSVLFPLIWAAGALAQKPGAPSGSPVWNDNALIAIQTRGGDARQAGEVKIECYGHDAFKITSPEGVTVLVDPWRNDPAGAYPKWFLHSFPALRVDIVLSTHAHFDHDAVDAPQGLMVLNRLAGEFKLGDVEITGLADKHACESTAAQGSDPRAEVCPPNNAIDLDNAIQVIATGGLRIAVWGDNRAAPNPSLEPYLKNVDVLILPVVNVLTPAEAEAILRRYDPKAVIPAHYFVEGLTAHDSGLESVDGWVKEQEKRPHADVRWLDGAELTLNPGELKGSHERIYYFGNYFKKR